MLLPAKPKRHAVANLWELGYQKGLSKSGLLTDSYNEVRLRLLQTTYLKQQMSAKVMSE